MLNFKNTTIAFILIFVGLFIVSLFSDFPIWIYIVGFGIWFALIAIGSFFMGLNFFTKSFTGRKGETRKRIAFTFDDGPHPEYTPIVLKLLKEYNAKATFFCIGKHVEQYPEIAKQIVVEGHTIGNHSYSHKNTISFKGTACWLPEIKKTDSILEEITGTKPTLFRPPFGVTTPHLAKAVELTYHNVVGWNIRPYDTVVKNKKQVLLRLRRKVKPGAVILLHDTHERIEDILEHMLLFVKEKGYKMVDLNTLMNE